MKRLLVFCVIAWASCVSTVSYAQELARPDSPRNFDQQFRGLLGHVQRAVVIVSTENFAFNRRMTELDLPSIGCTYEFKEPGEVDLLVRTLASSEIETHHPAPRQPINARLGIWLYLDGGGSRKLILERPMKYGSRGHLRDDDAQGIYQDHRVIARASATGGTPTLYQKVRELVVGMKPIRATYGCDAEQ